MTIKEFFQTKFQSKPLNRVLCGIGIIIAILIIFQAGTFMGYHKAKFSYGLGDNYYRTFGGHRGEGMMGGFDGDRDFSNSHGVIGKIINIKLPTILLEDQSGIEKFVAVNDDTVARRFRENMPVTDLKVNDFVVVVGSPNDSAQIEAKIIRLIPAPPDFMMGTMMGTSTATTTSKKK